MATFQNKDAFLLEEEQVPWKLRAVAAAIELVVPADMEFVQRLSMQRSPQYGESHCFAIESLWDTPHFSDELILTVWAHKLDNFVQVEFRIGRYGKLQQFQEYIDYGPESALARATFVEGVAEGLLSEVETFKTLNHRFTL